MSEGKAWTSLAEELGGLFYLVYDIADRDIGVV